MSQRIDCQEINCTNEAEFMIYGRSGYPEDEVAACTAHVGDLLGTPAHAYTRDPIGQVTFENSVWEVVSMNPRPDTRPPDALVVTEAPGEGWWVNAGGWNNGNDVEVPEGVAKAILRLQGRRTK